MTAILTGTRQIEGLDAKAPDKHTPTIVCDECGRRYMQSRCAPWCGDNSKGELILCRGKKGCMAKAKRGEHMTAYDKLTKNRLVH
jgi:hypothetical protein